MSTISLSQMIGELRESGMTQKLIASQVDSSQPQIARIQEGQTPNHALGKRIEDFYQDFFSKSQKTG